MTCVLPVGARDLSPSLAAILLRRLRCQQMAAVSEASHTLDASRVAVLIATGQMLGERASRLEMQLRIANH